MTTKYEFTGETKVVFGVTLKRIRALVKLKFVERGTVGGWIEGENNLANLPSRTQSKPHAKTRGARNATALSECVRL